MSDWFRRYGVLGEMTFQETGQKLDTPIFNTGLEVDDYVRKLNDSVSEIGRPAYIYRLKELFEKME